MRTKVLIQVREYGGSYIARAIGRGVTASTTGNKEWAIERVALKVKLGVKNAEGMQAKDHGITIDSVTSSLYHASWEEGS